MQGNLTFSNWTKTNGCNQSWNPSCLLWQETSYPKQIQSEAWSAKVHVPHISNTQTMLCKSYPSCPSWQIEQMVISWWKCISALLTSVHFMALLRKQAAVKNSLVHFKALTSLGHDRSHFMNGGGIISADFPLKMQCPTQDPSMHLRVPKFSGAFQHYVLVLCITKRKNQQETRAHRPKIFSKNEKCTAADR